MLGLLVAASLVAQLSSCETQAAVALGAANHEPAADVIQAADGVCAQQWTRVDADLSVGSFGAAHAGALGQLVLEQQARQKAETRAEIYAAAFQALAAARAGASR